MSPKGVEHVKWTDDLREHVAVCAFINVAERR